MMADLSVDIAGLEAFASHLESVRTAFGATPQIVGGSAPDLKNPDIERALDDFTRHWTASREVLDSYLAALAKMGKDSAAAMRAQDQSLADAARSGADARVRNRGQDL